MARLSPFAAFRSITAIAVALQLAWAQTTPAVAQSPRRNTSATRADTLIAKFPATIPSRGRLPLQLQIMLDRANFSPGIIDGAWGMNAAKALAFFAAGQETRNTAAAKSTGTIDRATYERLKRESGNAALLARYTLTAEDVRGPFVDIPSKVYQQAKLKCLCYSSAAEAMSEKFHVSRKLLAELNPQANLDKLRAGTTLVVPNVADRNVASAADTAIIARLIVSKSGFWTHAEDANGRILFHFPSTLGAGYDPSPTGDFKIAGVSHNPAFHYQPKLFSEVPDDRPDALLPPGPNSPVGVVWIGLSIRHYGIHGTSSPETIGYANSHGCVRLTNWDAEQLSDLVQGGTPVVFR